MIQTTTLILLLFISPLAIAEVKSPETSKTETSVAETTPEATTEMPNINKGNVAVAGSLGLAYSSYTGAIYFLNPSAEYFVLNSFSVGGTVQSTISKHSRSFGMGPSLSYYFWQNKKWASYIGAGALYTTVRTENISNQYTAVSQYWSANGTLGLNYFLTPSVSFGPVFNYDYTFPDDNPKSVGSSYSTLIFKLSVFL